MRLLAIPYTNKINKETSIDDISCLLNSFEKHVLNYTPWAGEQRPPMVSFSIAHDGHTLFLKYFVKEDQFKIQYLWPNDPVYKDSCVELFISFADSQEYYNFECNSIGTCLAGYGTGRQNRASLPASVIEQIKYQSFIKATSNSEYRMEWELTLIIPKEAFCFDKIESLRNIKATGNFYKCGEDLPVPHYLCWSEIHYPKPEFHLKEFFSKFSFD